jgi:hypothetical protein
MAKYQAIGDYDRWSMVLLYDPATGGIVASHQEISMKGATHPDPSALEKAAVEHATRAGVTSADKMAFLHVDDPSSLDYDVHYTVDVRTRALVKA